MLSNKEIVCPNNLLDLAHKKKGVKAAVVNAGMPLPMLSVQDAVKENIIEPIFIGDKKELQKCAEDLKWDISQYEIIDEPVENNTAPIAAKLASEDKVRIIVKGHIHTDILMKEVLKREYNLMGKARLSHIWHMTIEKEDSPLIITGTVTTKAIFKAMPITEISFAMVTPKIFAELITIVGIVIIQITLVTAVKEMDKATSPLANFVKTFEVTPPGAAAIIIRPTAIAEGRSRPSAMIKATIGNKIN